MKSLLPAGAMINRDRSLRFREGWLLGGATTRPANARLLRAVPSSKVKSAEISLSEPDLTNRSKTANWPVRRSPDARCRPTSCRTGLRRTKIRLVDGVAAAGHSVEADRCIELSQFRLKLLVHPQQRLERPGCRHCNSRRSDRWRLRSASVIMGYSFDYTLNQFVVGNPVPVDFGYDAGVGYPPIRHAHTWRKCRRNSIKLPMTLL